MGGISFRIHTINEYFQVIATAIEYRQAQSLDVRFISCLILIKTLLV